MKLYELETRLDSWMEPGKFKDYCPNGLLVDADGDPAAEISKVVTGVSLRHDLIDAAVAAKAQAIVVHHPNWFWNSDKDKRIVGNRGEYVRRLIKAGISLFGYHLPLDAHPAIGNNSALATMIFGKPRTVDGFDRFMEGIGCIHNGTVSGKILDRVFPKGYRAYNFDPEPRGYIVGICTGSGTSGLQDAIDCGCTMFITGEIHESTPIFAQENGIAVIAAGHHRTETFGVSELARWIANLPGMTAEFIDIDNPE